MVIFHIWKITRGPRCVNSQATRRPVHLAATRFDHDHVFSGGRRGAHHAHDLWIFFDGSSTPLKHESHLGT